MFRLVLDVQITLQTPFPGTPLYEELRRCGRLIDERAWHKSTLFDLLYEPHPMSRSELREGFRSLAGRLYSEELTNWRRENFKRHYLRGGNALRSSLLPTQAN
ncbi:MAG: hypothetical protein WD490_07205 [Opitutales bacterium]